ncbi:MAG TPA: MBL fold metallo-hydrolase [Gaiellaceae bacterium]
MTLVDDFWVEEVGPDAWAAISIPDRGAVGNAGIVDLGDGGSLVFDTMVTPRAGRALRAHAEQLVGPTRYVVNSHWHGDHRMGNGAFDTSAPILATPRTRELIASVGVERLEATKRAGREGYEPLLEDLHERGKTDKIALVEDFLRELPEIQQRLPDDTFEERRDLGRCELLTYGGGHTESDAFLLLPDDRILFAADLVVVRSHAWVGDGDVGSWRAILDRLRRLDFDMLVPGHGPVGGRDDVDAMDAYLADLLEAARTGSSMPERYRDWDFASGWDRNVAALSA